MLFFSCLISIVHNLLHFLIGSRIHHHHHHHHQQQQQQQRKNRAKITGAVTTETATAATTAETATATAYGCNNVAFVLTILPNKNLSVLSGQSSLFVPNT